MSHRKKRKQRIPNKKKKWRLTIFLLLLLVIIVLTAVAILHTDVQRIRQKSDITENGETVVQNSSTQKNSNTDHDTKELDQSQKKGAGGVKSLIGDTGTSSADSSNEAENGISDNKVADAGTNPTEGQMDQRANAADQDAEIEEIIRKMTLEEKVDRLFVLTPDQLTRVDGTASVGDTFRKEIAAHPIGGYVFFENNLKSPEQTKKLLSGIKTAYTSDGFPAPILSVDEEGGTVTRVAKNSAFGVTDVGNMSEIGKNGDPNRAAQAGDTIGRYLSDLGFNMDFAPDADVLTNPQNTVVAKRSFGSDPNLVTSMVRAECTSLLQHNICPVIKHFPGHGATEADTHAGYAYTNKTLDELLEAELVPFEDADEYAPVIMAAHISLPNVTGDNTPASLSRTMITDVLRGRLGYQGVVMTDALNMGAIANDYNSSEASVKALEAGCDMLLMPASFSGARQGVLSAIADGRLTEARIDESLRRILRLNMK